MVKKRFISFCLKLDLGSGAMICGVLFSITSVADDIMTPKFFHVAFFYSGLLIQLYSNCYYGSQVYVMVFFIFLIQIKQYLFRRQFSKIFERNG